MITERPNTLDFDVTRRELIRVGALGSAGLMLPELLAARATAAERGSFGRAKSCILCFLFGGPAHQDMWDLKPDAPDEVRGPFQPIATSVRGTFLSEHLPKTARQTHRFALVRSVTHPDSTHTVAMHYPTDFPVSPEDLAATIYHALGVPLKTEVIDHSGRPFALSQGRPLTSLFG